jgi:uncharacterized membrane protein YedE/YeeE
MARSARRTRGVQAVGGLGVGLAFGAVLCWSGMTSPVVIRQALLFERPYLFLFFATAVLTSAVGLALLRRARPRALLTGAPVAWARERVERRHIVGALVFGVGWGVADACPGPVATQVGQGIAWGLFTFAGVVIGVWAYLHREEVETEPAVDRPVVDRPAVVGESAPQAAAG